MILFHVPVYPIYLLIKLKSVKTINSIDYPNKLYTENITWNMQIYICLPSRQQYTKQKTKTMAI